MCKIQGGAELEGFGEAGFCGGSVAALADDVED
jgi:hypothetical protein